MDPNESVPVRSNFWFSQEPKEADSSYRLFDKTTVFVSFCLCLSTLIIFSPVIFTIDFEEAFFTPLVPILVQGLGLLNVPSAYGLKLVFIMSLMLSTVGIYLLVRDLTKRQVPAIFASAFYLIPPVPVFVLTFIKSDFLNVELASAKSFFTIVYGDGAHFLALALLPFAVLFYLRFLKHAVRRDFLITVLLVVLILLANRSQAFYLGLILLVCTITEIILGNFRLKLRRFLMVVVFSVGLVSFWYTPDFWIEGFSLAFGHFFENMRYLFPLPFILAMLSFLFSFVFFARREDRQPIIISFLVFIILSFISIDWILNGRSPIPHPQRIFPDLIMFFSIVLALSITFFFDKANFESKLKFASWTTWGRAIGTFGFAIISFLLGTVVAYFMSPIVILALAGPNGAWTKLRQSVLLERQQTISEAGGSLGLISQSTDRWQTLVGLLISVIFVIFIIFILFRKGKTGAGGII